MVYKKFSLTESNISSSPQISGHQSVFINEPRLSDFKQVLLREGIQAEFVGGVLVCNNVVAVRRVSVQPLYPYPLSEQSEYRRHSAPQIVQLLSFDAACWAFPFDHHCSRSIEFEHNRLLLWKVAWVIGDEEVDMRNNCCNSLISILKQSGREKHVWISRNQFLGPCIWRSTTDDT